MSEVLWQTEYSVETKASTEFAWAYMTNVSNWEDPPARFRLEGPFIAGQRGVTEMPAQSPLEWRLEVVDPVSSYVIRFSIEQGILSAAWRFTELSGGRTRLTQRISFAGDAATEYVEQVRQAFESSLAAGMHRIAAAIDRAYDRAQSPEPMLENHH